MTWLKAFLSLRWVDRLVEAIGYLCGLALILATLAVLHGVLTRYLLNEPTLWQTEFATYLLITVTLVGAAYGLKHHAHVGVDILLERLPARPQILIRIVTAMLALGVIVVVGWTSVHMWHEAYQGGHRSNTSWAVPLSIVYAILPLGMILLALQYLRMLIDAVICLLRSRPQEALLLCTLNADLFNDAPEGQPAGRAD